MRGRILAALMGIALAVRAQTEFTTTIREQRDRQWETDPVACLEAIREFARNSDAEAMLRLEVKLNPGKRGIYDVALSHSDPPEAFWRFLMRTQPTCAYDEVSSLVMRQLYTSPESIRQFLRNTDSADSETDYGRQMRKRARALFELAWPVRSNARAVNAYRACMWDSGFVDDVKSLF